MNTRTLKRSESNDDASSSLRDSGISVSEELSETKSERKEKRKSKRTTNKYYSCAVCGKSFGGSTDLRRHLLIHSDQKPHICKICEKAYRQEINLKNHMKIAHSSQKEFVCRFCKKPFALKLRLRLHLRVHTEEKLYTCPQCPKTFARKGQLQLHLETHDVSKNKSNKKKTTREEEKPICQICKKVFASHKAMRTHKTLAHDKVKQFECPICEKTIKEDLNVHMKSHTPSKRFHCKVCKAVFAQRCQFMIHTRTHTGERPYQCRVCWQNYGHSNVLRLHIRKHTGEKPFKCVLCKDNIAFSQLSHLKTHMKSIHSKNNAYACEGCQECFKAKFQLETHMQVCEKLSGVNKTELSGEEKLSDDEIELLANLRYLIAVLLKKISTKEKLAKLGFEKRLIDNVLIASLKLANRKCYVNKKINELDRMKLNIQAFLEWLVPAEVMDGFKRECPSVESILDKIITMYLNKVD